MAGDCQVTDAPEPTGQPILVVDDDDGNRLLHATALRRAGLTTLEAATGLAALSIIDATEVGVVVTDNAMPGMTGIDMVRTLRSRAETQTLPVILVTGSGHDQTVIEGLEAGADDFLVKPVRLEELVARVRAHLRTRAAWADVVRAELVVRGAVISALGSLNLAADPEEAAEAVVRELSTRTDSGFVSVAQVSPDGRMHELATYNRTAGVRRGGEAFQKDLAAYLLGRAATGPWVEHTIGGETEPTTSLRDADVELVASSPIYAADDLVGLLSIGVVADDRASTTTRQAKLLAAAVDYAGVLGAVAGSALAGRRQSAAERARLERILDARAFRTVYQPIVELDGLTAVGYEALTRFDDGRPPDVRFAEAARAGLGGAFELAAIRMAIEGSAALPTGAFVSVNLSPRTSVERSAEIRAIVDSTDRPVVIELTEHVRIEDYAELRRTLGTLGQRVQVAVDDAGAGFASMRHILELEPAFAKLDLSLVRGIDGDDLRQALAAGLHYYALRTGCRLIAEGVETQAEADTLKRLGIDLGQGYLFGRPRAMDDPAWPEPSARG